VNVRTDGRVAARRETLASTFANEDHLPRVPLPALEESCERFVAWCAPLLSAEQLAATTRAVTTFLRPGSPARLLQATLEEYDRRDGVHSWLDAFWSDRYLGRRDRIALNANFFCLFHNSDHDQVQRAAALVAAVINYKLSLDVERIPPVVERGRALSMEQNRSLFSTTRIPGPVLDTVRRPYSEAWPGPSRERHIVVFFRGHLFRLDVIMANGRPHTVDQLAAGLHAVMADPATAEPALAPTGHLTTKPRAEWAASRHALLHRRPGNAELLDTIERALFCLCLEETAPRDALEACDQLLHGDSANRWFDKSLSLIVFADGTAGVNVEHSGLDGGTIMSFLDGALGQPPAEHLDQSEARSPDLPPIAPLQFELDAELRADVSAAAASFAAAAANTATTVMSLDDFGAGRAKQLNISPDGFVQMAFQLAHKRSKGFVGATYESISTRHFHHGRTEAMRVVTPEVVRFVNTMDDPDADESARRTALRTAVERHVERAKECQAGLAPEQHLWELQLLQRRRGDAIDAAELPALYENPGWLVMRDEYLSTSSTPSTQVQFGGFGPTSSQCIGIGYMLLPERFNLHLSTPRPVADEMHRFAAELCEAIGEMQTVISN
jgi:carnitine O-acetyltransferase